MRNFVGGFETGFVLLIANENNEQNHFVIALRLFFVLLFFAICIKLKCRSRTVGKDINAVS